ncbi:MAG: GNAT family N-acetyltransferase [Phycisphaerae bacterium]|nr:GNAT family N-acetyltransferase [Phycisphaerae bacterium]
MKREVTITYLEMLDPVWLCAKECPKASFDIGECTHRQPDFFKYLYETIGEGWHWRERLRWSEQQWYEHAQDKKIRTWVAHQEKTIAGYFELKREDADTIEIGYFGLMPDFFGKGYGGYMLSKAIRLAWEWGAKRVWVHTCTLDHNNALPNYLARGMKVFKKVTFEDDFEPDKTSVE